MAQDQESGIDPEIVARFEELWREIVQQNETRTRQRTVTDDERRRVAELERKALERLGILEIVEEANSIYGIARSRRREGALARAAALKKSVKGR